MLTVIDELTRRCLAIPGDRKLNSESVLECIGDLFIMHGPPDQIRSDNRPVALTIIRARTVTSDSSRRTKRRPSIALKPLGYRDSAPERPCAIPGDRLQSFQPVCTGHGDSELRHVVVIFVTLLFTSCVTDSTTSSLRIGETPKIVDLYPKFRAHMASCMEAHGFDPLAANVDEHALAPGEKPWRECVYRGVDEYIIAYSFVPRLYKQIVAEDRVMTEQIARGELTRSARRSRIEALIELIRTEEARERDNLMRQAQELDDLVKREREFQEILQAYDQAMQAVQAMHTMTRH